MSGQVELARNQYASLGFDTLPLLPGSKKPAVRAWQSRLPSHLWKNVPQSANIGLRGGGPAKAAFLDCDEFRTFKNLTNWLAGLGYRGDSYPVVQSAHRDRRHVYVTFSGSLAGDARKFSDQVGGGEFRYGPGAYVLAPPSSLQDGGAYWLLSGDFSIRPTLDARDLLPLLGNCTRVVEQRQPLSRQARALLHGKSQDAFSSRSEAEQSLIVSLVNHGLTFPQVLDLFNRFPCAGKYAEMFRKNPRNAEVWLQRSYDTAASWALTQESKARQIAASAIAWASSKPWTGGTGMYDRPVYLAHAEIAYRAGRLAYAAACRDIAERAGISKAAAANATARLRDMGLIILVTEAVADCANIYRLGQLEEVGHFPTTPTVRKCPTLSPTMRKCPALSNHDAFRYKGLGKSAGEIWQVLQEGSATDEELVGQTGRSMKTVKRWLNVMATLVNPLTGEYLPMVASDDGNTWHALEIDLDAVAHAVGTAGKGERQRLEHAKERDAHKHALLLGQRTSKNERRGSGDREGV